MADQKNQKTIFKSNLKINYDTNFIPVAQSFVKSLAKICGANDRENYHISLAVEESLLFIMNQYIDDSLSELIDLTFALTIDNKIKIEITNFGPPIHIEKIPKFDPKDIDTIDGLWYQMASNVVDNLEFINNKNNGWLIRILKNIETNSFQKTIVKQDSDEPLNTKFNTRRAKPDDAAELVDLAFYTYRYSNGVPEFYDINSLREKIINDSIHIVVIENSEKIIGAVSIKYNDYNQKVAEMGSAMVIPEYRKSTALLRLIREMDRYHKENPKDVEIFESFLVTTHTMSQRSTAKVHHGYKPFSISLSMIPRPDYIDIKGKINSRESLLNAYHLNDKLKVKKIFVTQENEEIIDDIIKSSGSDLLLSTESLEITDQSTELSNFKIETIQSAIVNLNKFGINWFSTLRKELFSISASGIKTIIVSVKSNEPLPHNFENKLMDLNLIFCGLSLQSLSDVRLSYIMISETVDFESIMLDSPVAKKLLQHIRNRYEFVLNKNIES